MRRKTTKKRGRGKRKISPSQRTLYEFVESNDLISSENTQKSEISTYPTSSMEDGLIGTEKYICDLVYNHRLNELVSFFSMADQQKMQFSDQQLKSLYATMQQEMISEFGAPLSPSLFPQCIFNETPKSSTGTLSSHSKSNSNT